MLIDRINLESGEEVLAVSRRHIFLIILQLIGFLFLIFVPPFLLIFVSHSDVVVLTFDLAEYTALIIYLYTVWILSVWVLAFVAWTDYYLDILIITNHRLILANQKGFWRRSLASFRLERLQEINVEISGILPTLLDFGSLRAETAGHGEEEFHMDSLPDPRGLKAKIMKAVEA
ncbi:MAG: PH domain-containing protein [Candidatus Paceibacterota bacterium]